jgi:hypothetical protein
MSRVNELVHAVANLSHVERPYLENLLAIKKLRLAKDPVDLELEEAAAKVKMWETEWINLNSWTFQWALLKLTVSEVIGEGCVEHVQIVFLARRKRPSTKGNKKVK